MFRGAHFQSISGLIFVTISVPGENHKKYRNIVARVHKGLPIPSSLITMHLTFLTGLSQGGSLFFLVFLHAMVLRLDCNSCARAA